MFCVRRVEALAEPKTRGNARKTVRSCRGKPFVPKMDGFSACQPAAPVGPPFPVLVDRRAVHTNADEIAKKRKLRSVNLFGTKNRPSDKDQA